MADIFVARVGEIADRDRKIVTRGELEIGIFRLGGDYFAWENNCPHMGGPVCQGRVMNRVTEVLDAGKRSHGYAFVDEDVHVVCPWHGFEFNLRTGAHPGEPDTKLCGFEVVEKDGAIYVRV